jgi:hypothetical protein
MADRPNPESRDVSPGPSQDRANTKSPDIQKVREISTRHTGRRVEGDSGSKRAGDARNKLEEIADTIQKKVKKEDIIASLKELSQKNEQIKLSGETCVPGQTPSEDQKLRERVGDINGRILAYGAKLAELLSSQGGLSKLKTYIDDALTQSILAIDSEGETTPTEKERKAAGEGLGKIADTIQKRVELMYRCWFEKAVKEADRIIEEEFFWCLPTDVQQPYMDKRNEYIGNGTMCSKVFSVSEDPVERATLVSDLESSNTKLNALNKLIRAVMEFEREVYEKTEMMSHTFLEGWARDRPLPEDFMEAAIKLEQQMRPEQDHVLKQWNEVRVEAAAIRQREIYDLFKDGQHESRQQFIKDYEDAQGKLLGGGRDYIGGLRQIGDLVSGPVSDFKQMIEEANVWNNLMERRLGLEEELYSKSWAMLDEVLEPRADLRAWGCRLPESFVEIATKLVQKVRGDQLSVLDDWKTAVDETADMQEKPAYYILPDSLNSDDRQAIQEHKAAVKDVWTHGKTWIYGLLRGKSDSGQVTLLKQAIEKLNDLNKGVKKRVDSEQEMRKKFLSLSNRELESNLSQENVFHCPLSRDFVEIATEWVQKVDQDLVSVLNDWDTVVSETADIQGKPVYRLVLSSLSADDQQGIQKHKAAIKDVWTRGKTWIYSLRLGESDPGQVTLLKQAIEKLKPPNKDMKRRVDFEQRVREKIRSTLHDALEVPAQANVSGCRLLESFVEIATKLVEEVSRDQVSVLRDWETVVGEAADMQGRLAYATILRNSRSRDDQQAIQEHAAAVKDVWTHGKTWIYGLLWGKSDSDQVTPFKQAIANLKALNKDMGKIVDFEERMWKKAGSLSHIYLADPKKVLGCPALPRDFVEVIKEWAREVSGGQVSVLDSGLHGEGDPRSPEGVDPDQSRHSGQLPDPSDHARETHHPVLEVFDCWDTVVRETADMQRKPAYRTLNPEELPIIEEHKAAANDVWTRGRGLIYGIRRGKCDPGQVKLLKQAIENLKKLNKRIITDFMEA